MPYLLTSGPKSPRRITGFMLRRQIVCRRNWIPTKENNIKYMERSKQPTSVGVSGRCGGINSFKDLGLHGLSDACDPNLPLVKRILWGILWLALLIGCVTQCGMSLKHYISSPTNVNIRYHKMKFVTPPCVTLCTNDEYGRIPSVWPQSLNNSYGNISYTETYELLEKTNMTISNLWNLSTFEFDSLSYDIDMWSIVKPGSEHIEKNEVYTLTGVCLTFKSVTKLPCAGKQAFFHITASGKFISSLFDEFLVIFHSEAEIPLLRYHGPLVNGVYLPFNQSTTAVLRMEVEKHINSWNKPCISEADYFQCEANCFEKLIRAESRLKDFCRLPFMKQDESIRQCETAHELREILSARDNAADKMHDDDKDCNCHQPCKKVIYSEEYFLTDNIEELFEIHVQFPKCNLQVVTEVYSYETTNFIADIGGALGLYLGMSILSILAFLDAIVIRIRNVITRKLNANVKNQ